MNIRWICLPLALLVQAAQAAGGLVAPSAETLWPQWQARITVQAATLSPLATTGLVDTSTAQRGLQGGALLGDYYFSGSPALGGGFRASGGLMAGSLGGLPQLQALAGPRLGLAVTGGALPLGTSGIDSLNTLPYLGLGYSGSTWLSGLSITADLGLVAEHPGAAAGVGRALFGDQGMGLALREMRLSPVLQLGVRYTF